MSAGDWLVLGLVAAGLAGALRSWAGTGSCGSCSACRGRDFCARCAGGRKNGANCAIRRKRGRHFFSFRHDTT